VFDKAVDIERQITAFDTSEPLFGSDLRRLIESRHRHHRISAYSCDRLAGVREERRDNKIAHWGDEVTRVFGQRFTADVVDGKRQQLTDDSDASAAVFKRDNESARRCAWLNIQEMDVVDDDQRPFHMHRELELVSGDPRLIIHDLRLAPESANDDERGTEREST